LLQRLPLSSAAGIERAKLESAALMLDMSYSRPI